LRGNVAIIAALPDELKYVVSRRKWRHVVHSDGVEVWEHDRGGTKWVAACAGMGPERAKIAFDAALKRSTIDSVVSVGWAGALTGSLKAGAVAMNPMVIDAVTGERFGTSGWVSGMPVVVTVSAVADAPEKTRLATKYEADLVDMEAAMVALLAREKGLAFSAMKAVSDENDARLPELERFIDYRGQMKIGKFLLHIAVRPWTWFSVMRLGRNSRRAAENLATAIYDWLDDREYVRTRKLSEV
jgi:adenosylhomocysteine nucleosidase